MGSGGELGLGMRASKAFGFILRIYCSATGLEGQRGSSLC